MASSAVTLPSRDEVLAYLRGREQPVPLVELASAFGAHQGRSRKLFARFLRSLERDGDVLRNRRDEYGLVERMDLVRGRVIGHRDGFGFLAPDGGGDDLFLSPRQMRSLMHGDRAVVNVVGRDHRGRGEAALVEVLERGQQELVGRLVHESGTFFVIPDESRVRHDVLIAPTEVGQARDGDIVVVELIAYPDKRQRALGRVKEVLGAHMAPGMEIDVAIRSHNLPVHFADEALAEAKRLGATVRAHQKRSRDDIRDLPLVTIDGDDARDFDDAVFCRKTGNGWKLWVAIADVASYVKPGSALDEEAFHRGNSVYFPDRVLPMLPEELSNGLCSLKPDVDRLCMVCEMVVAQDGEVTRSRFYEAVMRSHARLTYDQVAKLIVRRDPSMRDAHASLAPHLDELYQLFKAFTRARMARGALELDSQETKVMLDAQGKVERIAPLQRNDAHRVIEECMVAANVCAARFITRRKVPALFRVHDGAKKDGLDMLRGYLATLGLTLGGGDRPSPKHYRNLLTKVNRRPDKSSIQIMVLRSLAQAVYAPRNIGHFGLALGEYAHFTSPIRRYADLVLHRAIKFGLGAKRGGAHVYDMSALADMGEHVSMTERRADDATRDAIAWLKCEFMLDKIGQSFDARVVAITPFGAFVVVEKLNIDGLVHISALGQDYYHHDAEAHVLRGESRLERFAIGDEMRVRLIRVDLDERKIDFERVTRQVRDNDRSPRRGPRARGRSRHR